MSFVSGDGSSTKGIIGGDIEIKGGSASGAEDSDIDSDGGHISISGGKTVKGAGGISLL